MLLMLSINIMYHVESLIFYCPGKVNKREMLVLSLIKSSSLSACIAKVFSP